MRPAEVDEFFARLQKNNPQPTTELRYNSVFELLISVMLSAQATDISVNKATGPLFTRANNPQAMLKLGEKRLKTLISSIGLYNSKASNIIKTCEILIKSHKGEVPNSRQELEALPGVGRKTANVVLNTAFGAKTIAVDTHVFRLSNRTGLAPGKTVHAVEENLMRRVPSAYLENAHHWLILHGRYICKAGTPLCDDCFLADLCAYDQKTGQTVKSSTGIGLGSSRPNPKKKNKKD